MMTRIFSIAVLALALSSAASAASESGKSIYQLPLSWKTDQGKPFEMKSFSGTPVIVSMTYTACTGACPLIIEKMKKVRAVAQSKGMNPRLLVITLDTGSQTPARLKEFRKHHGVTGPEWTFITGTPSGTRTLSMALGIKYYENPVSGEIQHDNRILLLNARGEIQKTLDGLDADPKAILQD